VARRRYRSLPGLEALSLPGSGHDKVLELFQAFERLRLDDEDEGEPDIVGQACHELAMDGSEDNDGCRAEAYWEPEPAVSVLASWTGSAPAPSLPAASESAFTTTAFPAARAAGIDMHCLAGYPPGWRSPT